MLIVSLGTHSLLRGGFVYGRHWLHGFSILLWGLNLRLFLAGFPMARVMLCNAFFLVLYT